MYEGQVFRRSRVPSPQGGGQDLLRPSFGPRFRWPLRVAWHVKRLSRWHALVLFFPLAALFGVLAYIAPGVLAPLNRLWAKFGHLLHMIISPGHPVPPLHQPHRLL